MLCCKFAFGTTFLGTADRCMVGGFVCRVQSIRRCFSWRRRAIEGKDAFMDQHCEPSSDGSSERIFTRETTGKLKPFEIRPNLKVPVVKDHTHALMRSCAKRR